MAKYMLGKLKPLRTDLIPPQGSIPAGVTADGKHQLWKRVKPVPVIEPKTDEHGNPVWKRHPVDGTPIVQVRRWVKNVETEDLFYLEDHGNGNVAMVPYRFPTEEEKQASERKAKIAALQPKLAEALVDSGMSVDDVIARLQGGATTPQETPAPEKEEPDVEYPVADGEDRWKLSNGMVFEGDEDGAVMAELEVAEARAQAEAVPES